KPPPPSSGELIAPPGTAEDSSQRLMPPDAQASAADVPVPQPKPEGGTLGGGSTQDQYNYAFGLLRQRDLDGAESAFKQLLHSHPKDPLAPNAQYWLGETYYGRENYTAAAATFAESYQKYPQSPKAAESLLKLGMSLGNQGRKQDACLSFVRLDRSFPN